MKYNLFDFNFNFLFISAPSVDNSNYGAVGGLSHPSSQCNLKFIYFVLFKLFFLYLFI